MKLRNYDILLLGDVVPFKEVTFKRTEKLVFNLESSLVATDSPAKNKIVLTGSESCFENSFGKQALCISLANNHIMDYGNRGFTQTLQILNELKIPNFGAGNCTEEAIRPLIVTIRNMKIGFLGFCCPTTSPIIAGNQSPGCAFYELNNSIEIIGKLKEKVDRILVYIHWGIEESSLPRFEDIKAARKMINAGADIIVGSHAHASQPVERYRNGIIAYGLGNFMMPKLNNIPSYFNELGEPTQKYFKRLNLWNRISLGLKVDLECMDYKVQNYITIGGRIFKLPFPFYNSYKKILSIDDEEKYNRKLQAHIKKRNLSSRIIDFILAPHIPNRLKTIMHHL